MSEGRTEREALLEARVKELEDAARTSTAKAAQGGIFEEIWQATNKIVPPWLAVIALAVFLGHHAFGYYVGAQVAQAETELKQAKADVEKAKADALNSPVGRASVRLAELKAELSVLQNQATLARAKADAASKKSGLQTLREREATAKVVATEMKAASDRVGAAMQNTVTVGGTFEANIVRAACEGNEFAQLVDCPAQYVRQAQQAPQPEPENTPGEVTTAALPSAAAAQPAPTLRKPEAFDCSRASMGADFVICASDELLDAEARLEDAYKAARAASGDSVRSEQIAWIKRYGPNCGLPFRGRPASALIEGARQCVLDAMTKRIDELKSEQ
jgi:uncharacterized protein YecT (DUF1311 family)